MPGGTDMLVFETSKLLLEPLNQSEWENYLEHLDMYNEYYFQYGQCILPCNCEDGRFGMA